MADKPYRTYRGGEAPAEPESPVLVPPARRGAIELPPPGAPPPIVPPRIGRRFGRGPGWRPRTRPPRGLRSWLLIVLGVVLVLVLGWVLLGVLALRSSIQEANARLDPRAQAALSPASGSILSSPTAVLVIGVDAQANSDSLQVIRFDPDQRLVATLAIPRDLRVNVPGYGDEKINAAYAAGGSPLALQTVQAYTGLQIDHVVVVEFDGIVGLVDAVGGITIDNPRAIRSIFEKQLHTFPKGEIDLDGQEALAYARVRRNILSATDSDVSRGQRQQLVVAALRDRLSSPAGILRLRGVAGAVGEAAATDLSLGEIAQLAWVDRIASRRIRCNLGGTPAPLDGQDVLIPDGAGNRRVLGEFLGEQAIQPPASRSIFAARCAES
jgi:LCP family protein required for cell wall assembly